jgi:hypothetical protein
VLAVIGADPVGYAVIGGGEVAEHESIKLIVVVFWKCASLDGRNPKN